MRKLGILLIVGVAMLLVGCSQSTTASGPTATQSPAGPFDFEGVWAAVDDDGAKILLLVVEDNPDDYTLSLGVRSADGQSADKFYEHGVAGGGAIRWPNGWVLIEGVNGDLAVLSVEKPGAKVNPLVVYRQKAGTTIDWDSF